MKHTIKGKQIAAARTLAGMTLTELAEQSGVSRSTIVKIESGAVQPREGTLADLIRTFASAGVEFIDDGVRWIGDTIRTFEGPDAYLLLLDEVYHKLHRQPGSEALFICIDDDISTPDVVTANNRIRDAGISCRYLCSAEAKRFDQPVRDYRLIPKRFYTNSVMIVFADCVATLSDSNDAVIVVRDIHQANMLRGLFEMTWQQCPAPRPPPRERA